MPYAPLWSGLDLDLIDPTVSRVTDAFVESTNKVIKEMVCKRISNRSIADRVREFERYREDTLSKISLNIDLKSCRSKKRSKYPEAISNPFIEEKWRKERKGKPSSGHASASKLKKLYAKMCEKKMKYFLI